MRVARIFLLLSYAEIYVPWYTRQGNGSRDVILSWFAENLSSFIFCRNVLFHKIEIINQKNQQLSLGMRIIL
jgi:hypothetical protein